MANFIKESISELEHVVWPTHLETKKFFTVVVGIIVTMTLFTYLLTLLFSNGLFAIRNALHAPVNADISGSPITVNGVDANGAPITVQTSGSEEAPADAVVPEAPAPEVAPN